MKRIEVFAMAVVVVLAVMCVWISKLPQKSSEKWSPTTVYSYSVDGSEHEHHGDMKTFGVPGNVVKVEVRDHTEFWPYISGWGGRLLTTKGSETIVVIELDREISDLHQGRQKFTGASFPGDQSWLRDKRVVASIVEMHMNHCGATTMTTMVELVSLTTIP